MPVSKDDPRFLTLVSDYGGMVRGVFSIGGYNERGRFAPIMFTRGEPRDSSRVQDIHRL